jgi:hypothetical protein
MPGRVSECHIMDNADHPPTIRTMPTTKHRKTRRSNWSCVFAFAAVLAFLASMTCAPDMMSVSEVVGGSICSVNSDAAKASTGLTRTSLTTLAASGNPIVPAGSHAGHCLHCCAGTAGFIFDGSTHTAAVENPRGHAAQSTSEDTALLPRAWAQAVPRAPPRFA